MVVGPRAMRPVQVGPSPWDMPPPPPVMDRYTGSLKLGLIFDAAAQVLASMASLPAAPVAYPPGRLHLLVGGVVWLNGWRWRRTSGARIGAASY